MPVSPQINFGFLLNTMVTEGPLATSLATDGGEKTKMQNKIIVGKKIIFAL